MTSYLDIMILTAIQLCYIYLYNERSIDIIVEDGILTKFRYKNGKLDRETNQ